MGACSFGSFGSRSSHVSQKQRDPSTLLRAGCRAPTGLGTPVGPGSILLETLSHRLTPFGWKEHTVSNQNNLVMRRQLSGALQARLALCLWAIFAAGWLVEMAAPRWKIENNAFVMPPISDAQAPVLRPMAIV